MMISELIAVQWRDLFRSGAIAALTVVVFLPVQMAVFFAWPPPSTVIGWFSLFNHNAIIGLLDMDLLLIVDYALLLVVFAALWAALRSYNQSLMTIALVLQIVSAAAFFASAVAFEMLSLSGQYFAATTDSQRDTILAVGTILLSTWQGTAFDVGYILGCASMLIASTMMLRSRIFSKATAYIGIGTGILMVLPPTAGTIGLILSLASVPPTAVWLVLIARRLWKISSIRNTVAAST